MRSPIQVASASWPLSMKRPSQTAMNTGRMANVADTIPSQTTGRPSSTMR
jgi:thiazole synthase ThiGH ThiG subunit